MVGVGLILFFVVFWGEGVVSVGLSIYFMFFFFGGGNVWLV